MRPIETIASSFTPARQRSRRDRADAGRGGRVNTSGAETFGVLFLLLVCLVAVLTSLSNRTSGGGGGGGVTAPPEAAPAAALAP